MPVAIVVLEDQLPAILRERTERGLLAALDQLVDAPHIESSAEAIEWLSTLAYPSGWFHSIAAAKAHIEGNPEHTMDGTELKNIRTKIGETRANFALKLGYRGNENTRHKQIFELETNKKPIMPDRADKARALVAEVELAE